MTLSVDEGRESQGKKLQRWCRLLSIDRRRSGGTNQLLLLPRRSARDHWASEKLEYTSINIQVEIEVGGDRGNR